MPIKTQPNTKLMLNSNLFSPTNKRYGIEGSVINLREVFRIFIQSAVSLFLDTL